jgi:hypothetical protein
VSDAHPVCSHPVCPDLTDPVHALGPMLAPCTVTILVPVEIALPAATLSPPRSTDIAAEWLPTRLPTLIDTRTLPCDLDPTRHTAEVSDAQPVPSHMLCPSLPDTDCPASPILAPCIVTLVDPLPPAFTRRPVLDYAESTESAPLRLPTRRHPLIANSLLPAIPAPASHRTDVSDSHAVRSHDDEPTLPDPENEPDPRPAPYTLALVDPVVPAFARRTKLTSDTSIDNAWLTLPTPHPTCP